MACAFCGRFDLVFYVHFVGILFPTQIDVGWALIPPDDEAESGTGV